MGECAQCSHVSWGGWRWAREKVWSGGMNGLYVRAMGNLGECAKGG
jgi:hypothetical protein